MAQGKINEDTASCNGENAVNMIIFDEDKQVVCEAAGLGSTYFNGLVSDKEMEEIKNAEMMALEELAAKLGKNIEDLTKQEIDELLEKIDFQNPRIIKVHNDINQDSMRKSLEGTNEYTIASAKDNSSREIEQDERNN